MRQIPYDWRGDPWLARATGDSEDFLRAGRALQDAIAQTDRRFS